MHHSNRLGILLDDEVREEAHIHAVHAELMPLIISQSEELLVEFEHLTIGPLAFHFMELDEAGHIRVPGSMTSAAAVRRVLMRWEELEIRREHQAWLAYLGRHGKPGMTVSND